LKVLRTVAAVAAAHGDVEIGVGFREFPHYNFLQEKYVQGYALLPRYN